MTGGPWVFLITRGLRNRVVSRWRRLRRPKYLISAVAGLVYLLFVALSPLLRGSSAPALQTLQSQMLLGTVLAFLLLVIAVVPWIFPATGGALFTEAEMQFLFPAPVSRRSLLHYRIARSQPAILFGALVSWAIFGQSGVFPRQLCLIVTLWTVYTIINLSRMAAALSIRSRRHLEHSRLAAFAVLVSTVVAVGVWGRRLATSGHFSDPFALLAGVMTSGPLSYALWPFRMLVRPAFASHLGQAASELAFPLAVLGLLYLWIVRLRDNIEEAALGLWRSDTSSLHPRRGAPRPRQAPFTLRSVGFAPVAIYWKNLVLLGGVSIRRGVALVSGTALVSVLALRASGEAGATIGGAVTAALAAFLVLMGPVLFRDDLRADLVNIDILKTYPLPGWGIVLGEMAAPATVLAFLASILAIVALCVLPESEELPLTFRGRLFFGMAAVVLIPLLSFLGVLAQNAAVLLFPGWVQLGREHQRGVEAMGQRLISSIASTLFLALATFPAALFFSAVYAAGERALGDFTVPLAFLIAAAALVAEAAAGVLWLGRVFDRFDPSKEMH